MSLIYSLLGKHGLVLHFVNLLFDFTGAKAPVIFCTRGKMAKGFAKKFYASDAWRRCRDGYIAERVKIDGGMCELCHRVPGEEVHHVKMLTPGNISDPEVSLSWKNLKFLCRDCHFKVHRELILEGFKRKSRQRILNDRGFYFDESGRMRKMEVTIVYGAPMSGKTTYVRDHMNESDLVVDLSEIEKALGWHTNSGTSNLLPLALRIREMIYQLIEDRDQLIDCRHTWVIATLPHKKEREDLARRLDADLYMCEATQKDCEDRARQGDEEDKQLELALIEKWFEDYEG